MELIASSGNLAVQNEVGFEFCYEPQLCKRNSC